MASVTYRRSHHEHLIRQARRRSHRPRDGGLGRSRRGRSARQRKDGAPVATTSTESRTQTTQGTTPAAPAPRREDRRNDRRDDGPNHDANDDRGGDRTPASAAGSPSTTSGTTAGARRPQPRRQRRPRRRSRLRAERPSRRRRRPRRGRSRRPRSRLSKPRGLSLVIPLTDIAPGGRGAKDCAAPVRLTTRSRSQPSCLGHERSRPGPQARLPARRRSRRPGARVPARALRPHEGRTGRLAGRAALRDARLPLREALDADARLLPGGGAPAGDAAGRAAPRRAPAGPRGADRRHRPGALLLLRRDRGAHLLPAHAGGDRGRLQHPRHQRPQRRSPSLPGARRPAHPPGALRAPARAAPRLPGGRQQRRALAHGGGRARGHGGPGRDARGLRARPPGHGGGAAGGLRAAGARSR